MKDFNWKGFAELIGVAAIVASLVFVSLQLKQSDEIALSSSYQARSQMSIDISLAASSSPEFTSGTAKLYRGAVGEITPEEYVALEYNFGALMTMWENQHFQYEAGFMPAEHWAKNLSEMRCVFASQFYRDLLNGWVFRKSFQIVVDEAINSSYSSIGNCSLISASES